MAANQAVRFRWTLENFRQCLHRNCQPVYSPIFAADVPKQSYWRLKLYQSRDWVSCYLEYHRSNKCPRVKVDFELILLTVDNVDYVSRTFEEKAFKPGRGIGAKEFAHVNDLVTSAPLLLPEGHLTIECRITVSLESDGDLHRLSRIFLGLFWTSVFSDLVLKTKTEQKFRVHRELIRARARKFHRVHGLGVKQTVKIPGTPPDVLQAFLMYLYSGMIRSTDPEVWDRLYQMAERYEVFHLRRDIAPTPTEVAVTTRVNFTSKTVIFPIRNFRDVSRADMGRLVDLGFARVGLEYATLPCDPLNVTFEGRFFVSDNLDTPKTIGCSVSVLDVPGWSPFFTSPHNISCGETDTPLRLLTGIPKESLLNDMFLVDGTITFKITFRVVSTGEPVRIQSYKSREASCIGLNPPSIQTLQALSMDLGKLVESSPLPDLNASFEFSNMQKAVFSAWSWVFRDLFKPRVDPNPANRRSILPDTFKLLYRYMCTGKIPIPLTDAAFELYAVAKEYELVTLRELIVKKVKSQLGHGTAVESLMFAYAYNIEELLVLVKNFIRQNFGLVSNEDTWKHFCYSNPALVETIFGDG